MYIFNTSEEVQEKYCKTCKQLLPFKEFTKDKNLSNGISDTCIDCSFDLAKRQRKLLNHISSAVPILGFYYIPNVYLVGYGRKQALQHSCLSCAKPFFCSADPIKIGDLFCDDCFVDEEAVLEDNKSKVNYMGNIIGWIIKTQGIGKKRCCKNYKKVYERDHYTCQYCGYTLEYAKEFRALHIDHIIPWSASGGNGLNNMVVSCAECNLSVSDKIFDSFSKKKEYILSIKSNKNQPSQHDKAF